MVLATLLVLCCTFTADTARNTAKPSSTETSAPAAALRDLADARVALPDSPSPKVDVASKTADDAVLHGSESSSAAVQPLTTSPVKPATPESYETPRKRKIWYGLIAAGHSASVLDAWTTRRAISGGYGVEGDPLQRPFANSGAVYASTQVCPLVMDLLGRHMMRSNHAWMRKVWWVPQAAGASVSLGAAIHNYRLVP